MDEMVERRRRIRALQFAPQRTRIFGAEKHAFAPKPVPEADVVTFEAWFGCRLPEEYRALLRDTGPIGPYYGLLSFGAIHEELDYIAEGYQKPNVGYGDRPLRLDDVALQRHLRGEAEDVPGPGEPGGFLPICLQGCEFVTVLVTTGPLRGLVFDCTCFATEGSRWRCPKTPPGARGPEPPTIPIARPVTVSQWLDAWLTVVERDAR